MNRIRTILVAVDCSGPSRAALRQAAQLAEWRNAELHIVHVVDEQVVSELAMWWDLAVGEARERCMESARLHVTRFVAQVKPVRQAKLHILSGVPIESIRRLSSQLRADLVVGGMNSDPEKVGAGMMATRLVRKLPTKVLLVDPSRTAVPNRILACVDFSDNSQEVIRQAQRLVELSPAEVIVFHAYHRPWEVGPAGGDHEAGHLPPAEVERRLRRRLDTYTEAVCGATGIPNLDIEVAPTNGSQSAIADFARRQEVDLVVIGARGMSDVEYVTIGSTAERLIRELPCSVLFVKPEA